jgi:hypothetical protein
LGVSRLGEHLRSVVRGGAHGRAAARVCLLALPLAALACSEPTPPAGARVSVLAVGDTGARPSDLRAYLTHRTVADAIGEEDRAHPVQALVLLGDNFYDRGLRQAEIEPRVRANLVLPFCRFLAPVAESTGTPLDACTLPKEKRHPIPIYAVLGNHDYLSPESPALQRETIPRLVPNWRMPASGAEVHELDGVSLVLFDSDPVKQGEPTVDLRDALRRAQGPWRIIAAHHPIADLRQKTAEQKAHNETYRERVVEAIAAAGVPVHVFMAGHEHNLQVLVMDPPAPALHVIAGSGSTTRAIRHPNPLRRASFDVPGFARVDLVGSGEDERLVASLHRVPPFPLASIRGSLLVARWSVDRSGGVAEESPEPATQ